MSLTGWTLQPHHSVLPGAKWAVSWAVILMKTVVNNRISVGFHITYLQSVQMKNVINFLQLISLFSLREKRLMRCKNITNLDFISLNPDKWFLPRFSFSETSIDKSLLSTLYQDRKQSLYLSIWKRRTQNLEDLFPG